MGDMFSSKQETTSRQSTQVPVNFAQLMDRSISFANEGLDTPFQGYNAPRIADLSANEQAGIAGAGQNAGMYQGLIDMAAMNNADMQARGGVPTAGDLNQFINPYVDYVLGNSLNRLNEQSDTNMTKIGSAAGMSGAFGGLRHGVLEGANLAELLKSSGELSANTYSDAFDKGMGNWFKSQDLRRGTIQDGLNVARGGQAYNTQDIQNLMSTGLVGRTRDQSVLDFAFSEFMREQTDPMQKASFATSIMGAYPTNLFTRDSSSTTTSTPSAFSQIAGIGLAAAGIASGNPAAAMAGLNAGQQSLGAAGIGAPGSNGGGIEGAFLDDLWRNNGGGGGKAKGGLIKKYAEGGKIPEFEFDEDSWNTDNKYYSILDQIPKLVAPVPTQINSPTKLPKSRERYLRNNDDIPGIDLIDLFPAFDNKPILYRDTDEEKRARDYSKYVDRYLNITKKGRDELQDRILNSSYGRDSVVEDMLAAAVQEAGASKGPDLENITVPFSPLDAILDPEILREQYTYTQSAEPSNKKYAKGGKVKKFGGGGFLEGILGGAVFGFGDEQRPQAAPAQPMNAVEALTGGARQNSGWSPFGNGRRGQQAQPYTPQQRPAFDWASFMERQGLNRIPTAQSNVNPNYLNRGRPDLSSFMQALQQRIQGGQPSGGGSLPMPPFQFSGGGQVGNSSFYDKVMKKGRKSTNVEDWRGKAWLTPDAKAAQEIPEKGTPASWAEQMFGVDPWAMRFDAEANELRAKKAYDRIVKEAASLKDDEDLSPTDRALIDKAITDEILAKRAYAIKYGSKLDLDSMLGAKPVGNKFAKGGSIGSLIGNGLLGGFGPAALAGKHGLGAFGILDAIVGNDEDKDEDTFNLLDTITKGFNEGGTVLKLNNKKNKNSKAVQSFLDNVMGFMPTDEEYGGGNTLPIKDLLDKERVFKLALQKHESAAKEYDKPNYKARPIDENGKPLSTAFGAIQTILPTWNLIAKKSNGKIPFWTREQLDKGEFPDKAVQDKAWDIWNGMLRANYGNDFSARFAAHQLGDDDFSKVRKANPNALMRDVVGDKVARNVSAKDKTVGQYLNTLNTYIDAAEKWEYDRLVKTGGVVTDVLDLEPGNYGTEEPVKKGTRKTQNKAPSSFLDELIELPGEEARLTKQQNKLDEVLRRRAYANFRKDLELAQPNRNLREDVQMPTDNLFSPRRDRKSNKTYTLDELFGAGRSELFQGMNAVPFNALPKVRKPVFSDLTPEEEIAMSLQQGAGFNKGGYVKKFSDGGSTDYLNAGDFFGDLGMETVRQIDRDNQEARDILAGGWDKDSSLASNVLSSIPRGLASTVPTVNAAWKGAGLPVIGALDFMFGGSGGQSSPKGNSLLDGFNELRKPPKPWTDVDMRGFKPDVNPATSAEEFIQAMDSGDPSSMLSEPAQGQLAEKEDALTSAFRSMIMQEIENRKNYKEPDENKLFGMNVNMPLVKMGLGILANSGYPNSAGEAIGKGVLGALDDQEKAQLAKQERNNTKLKELLNLRYMQAMVESMDPNIKKELARQKAAADLAEREAGNQHKLQQIEYERSLAHQAKLAEIEAQAKANNSAAFGGLGTPGEGRVDLTE